MMLNCFGIEKLHGFVMHSVMLAVGCISRENSYSFQFSNVGSYATFIGYISPLISIVINMPLLSINI